jgi:hypothetical protein
MSTSCWVAQRSVARQRPLNNSRQNTRCAAVRGGGVFSSQPQWRHATALELGFISDRVTPALYNMLYPVRILSGVPSNLSGVYCTVAVSQWKPRQFLGASQFTSRRYKNFNNFQASRICLYVVEILHRYVWLTCIFIRRFIVWTNEEQREMEADYSGGQSSPWAVAPRGKRNLCHYLVLISAGFSI